MMLWKLSVAAQKIVDDFVAFASKPFDPIYYAMQSELVAMATFFAAVAVAFSLALAFDKLENYLFVGNAVAQLHHHLFGILTHFWYQLRRFVLPNIYNFPIDAECLVIA